MTTPFAKLLAELVRDYGSTKAEFAAAAKLNSSQLSRLLRPSLQSAQRHHAHADVVTCLRIAKISNCSGSKVLRAAGLSDVADLIEDLYGEAAERRLNNAVIQPTQNESRHLVEWRQLTPSLRKAIGTLIHGAVTALLEKSSSRAKELA